MFAALWRYISASEELADAVRQVGRGVALWIRSWPRRYGARKGPLTCTERLILRRDDDGETAAKLARSLHRGNGTQLPFGGNFQAPFFKPQEQHVGAHLIRSFGF